MKERRTGKKRGEKKEQWQWEEERENGRNMKKGSEKKKEKEKHVDQIIKIKKNKIENFWKMNELRKKMQEREWGVRYKKCIETKLKNKLYRLYLRFLLFFVLGIFLICHWGSKYAACFAEGQDPPYKIGCLGYVTKLHLIEWFQFWSSGECQFKLTSPLLPRLLCPGVLVPVTGPSIRQKEVWKFISIRLNQLFCLSSRHNITPDKLRLH